MAEEILAYIVADRLGSLAPFSPACRKCAGPSGGFGWFWAILASGRLYGPLCSFCAKKDAWLEACDREHREEVEVSPPSANYRVRIIEDERLLAEGRQ